MRISIPLRRKFFSQTNFFRSSWRGESKLFLKFSYFFLEYLGSPSPWTLGKSPFNVIYYYHNLFQTLKIYAWEFSFEEKILKLRSEEIRTLTKIAYLNTIVSFVWTTAPYLVIINELSRINNYLEIVETTNYKFRVHGHRTVAVRVKIQLSIVNHLFPSFILLGKLYYIYVRINVSPSSSQI